MAHPAPATPADFAALLASLTALVAAHEASATSAAARWLLATLGAVLRVATGYHAAGADFPRFVAGGDLATDAADVIGLAIDARDALDCAALGVAAALRGDEPEPLSGETLGDAATALEQIRGHLWRLSGVAVELGKALVGVDGARSPTVLCRDLDRAAGAHVKAAGFR
jgi:hypothetical protein